MIKIMLVSNVRTVGNESAGIKAIEVKEVGTGFDIEPMPVFCKIGAVAQKSETCRVSAGDDTILQIDMRIIQPVIIIHNTKVPYVSCHELGLSVALMIPPDALFIAKITRRQRPVAKQADHFEPLRRNATFYLHRLATLLKEHDFPLVNGEGRGHDTLRLAG
nr:hypothetical protein [Rhizobium skierniewicense]